MESNLHPSDSKVQTDAETAIVAAAATRLGVSLARDKNATTIRVGNNARVKVDAASLDGSVLVEVYARQGRLKKVAQDILKLTLVGNLPNTTSRKRVIVFASPEAEQSISGWIREAASHFGVIFMVVDIPDELRESIHRAQNRQIMVNVDQVADDVTPTLQ